MIAHVGEISLSQDYNNGAERYVLCPLTADHNRFVPRLSYDEVLKTSLEINDTHGYPCEIKKVSASFIFQRCRLRRLLVFYMDIIATDHVRYVHLQKIC